VLKRLWFRKPKPKGPAHRLNRWKGARANQAAEERQQRKRSQFWSRCRLGLIIVGAVAAGGVLLWVGSQASRQLGPIVQRGLEIREVRIEGAHHVSKQDILDRLGLQPGVGLHQVSLAFLADRLRTHPWIKEATLERRPLHELRITVRERTPAAIARIGSEHLLTDGEGALLAKLGTRDDPTLPLLIGLELKPLVQGDAPLRKRVQSAVELARLMANSVEGRVEIDLTHPLSLTASTKGVRFQFGSEGLVDQWNRFRMVKAVFKPTLEGKRREGGEVDLRYDNRVIVRERG